ncbi:CocE/NonD family hydrolase [Sphingosinicella rhizophila]|uniref:CocE/NonD family hydrolase n=1 Tax=Sphingosinicella rhizophila TaxID=3050082 RepID=A0ABU3QAQ6_9SPHN|nr:CocE/NonD family hydrolase [Sphingosinicella sp. GR2756]MDT9600214.1 CocE/NonD family hydrolase [Sphingosinicella sp. GR2756]
MGRSNDKSRRAFLAEAAAATIVIPGWANAGTGGSSFARLGGEAGDQPFGSSAIRVVNGLPAGEISPAIHSRPRREYNLLAPMRDGARLAVDIIAPDAEGPFPVILTRTPYDKTSSRTNPFVLDLVRRGYLVAAQDVRGRFNSDGEFDPYRQEHDDGYDTVEWLARQPWCDGNVGMIGGSYVGQTQWFAASHAPPALKAIVPTVSPPGHPFMNEPLYGGSAILAMPEWMVAMGRRSFQMADFSKILEAHQDYFEALPLSKLERISGTSTPWWQEWMKHPKFDAFWESCGYEQYWPRIKVPALNITGWWDMNFLGAPRNFAGMRVHGRTEEAREGQRLVIGPWPHHVNQTRELNGIDFGLNGIVDLNSYTIRFFDRWLRGRGKELDADPRVHIFVVGANQWWEADTWPLPGTRQTPLYLHSQGRANSHRGDGALSFARPRNESPDSYVSDPLDPVRFPWRLEDGPVDDRPVAARPDVLCYTSDVITQPLDVVGPINAVLFASSSARDCDWHVRLADVHPDGSVRFMCHGVLRARFRNGYERGALLRPDEITRFEIDMTATGIRFLPGHRIRIEIASSWFPRFDRNLQTGADNFFTDTGKPVVARQRVYHDHVHPSHISLPVIVAAPRA